VEYLYETHVISDKLIPFIFQKNVNRNGKSARMNIHSNIEILFCVKGEGRVMLGSETHYFEKDAIVIVNPDTFHMISSDTEVFYYCLIIDSSFFEQNGIDIMKYVFLGLVCDDLLKQKFEKIIEAFALKGELCKAKVRLEILDFVLALIDGYSCDMQKTPTMSNSQIRLYIKKTIEYVNSNFKNSILLEDIASYVGVSKYYLTRLFRKRTGITIFEYINLIRCKAAAAYLSEGKSVTTSARMCGFDNLSYFTRTYKKYIGRLPSSNPDTKDLKMSDLYIDNIKL